MDKLEQLANIKIKELDIKQISDFFETIKSVEDEGDSSVEEFILKPEQLRSDTPVPTTEEDKALIHKNFPKIQGTYLVVPKVIQS